jgi:hypothetical protein
MDDDRLHASWLSHADETMAISATLLLVARAPAAIPRAAVRRSSSQA